MKFHQYHRYLKGVLQEDAYLDVLENSRQAGGLKQQKPADVLLHKAKPWTCCV